jgi:hypothetical protein
MAFFYGKRPGSIKVKKRFHISWKGIRFDLFSLFGWSIIGYQAGMPFCIQANKKPK